LKVNVKSTSPLAGTVIEDGDVIEITEGFSETEVSILTSSTNADGLSAVQIIEFVRDDPG